MIFHHNLSRLVGKPTMWFPNRSDTNRPVQLQKQARSLKFWGYVEEELYYPSSENKGADQLRSYCEADLRLCFRIGNNPVFSRCGSIMSIQLAVYESNMIFQLISTYYDEQEEMLLYITKWKVIIKIATNF